MTEPSFVPGTVRATRQDRRPHASHADPGQTAGLQLTPRAMTCPPPWKTGVLGAYRGGRSTLDMNGRSGRGKRHTTGCRFAVVRFRKRLGRGRRHDEGDEQDRSAAHGVDAGGSRRIL